jgi:superfamily II DNA or RNA helicase
MTAFLSTPTPLSLVKPKLTPPVLREDQLNVKRQGYQLIREGHKRIQFVCPCGWGKTVLAVSLIHDIAFKAQEQKGGKERKVLFLVHATCLVDQTIQQLATAGIWAGIIAGGYKENRHKNVQVAMVQTLVKRDISWFVPDVIIADEAHESLWYKWSLERFPKLKDGQTIFTAGALDNELRAIGFNIDATILNGDRYPTFEEVKHQHKEFLKSNHPDRGGSKEITQQANAAWDVLKDHRDLFDSGDRPTNAPILIGLTATPWRLSKRQSMGDIFPVQVLGPTPGEMVALGQATNFQQGLVPFVYWGIGGAETKSLRVPRGGSDFTEAQLDESFAIPEVVQCAVDNYMDKSKGRRFVCFPVSIHHAQMLVHAFTRAGIPCALIKGDTPNGSKDKITDKETRNSIYAKVRKKELMGIISVGCINLGFDLPEISCVIDCCPTLSRSKYVQGAGRGQRIAPWDGKVDCHYLDQAGNVMRHGQIESIQYGELTPAGEIIPEEAPMKECPECHRLLVTFHMKCIHCGYEFPAPEKELAVGDMQLIVREDEEGLYYAFKDLLRQAYQFNNAPYWAEMQINEHELYKTHKSVKNKQIQLDKKGKHLLWHPVKAWYHHAIFEKPTKEDEQAYMQYLQNVASKYAEPKPDWWFRNYMKKEFGEGWNG